MKLTTWTTALLAGLAFATQAQAIKTGTITGRVSDPSGQHAIAAAVVTVEGTAFAATTALDGGYTIRNVPAGAYLVRADKDGVRSLQRVTVTAGATATANFTLRIAVVDAKKTKDAPAREATELRPGSKMESDELRSRAAPGVMSPLPAIGRLHTLGYPHPYQAPWTPADNESYRTIEENAWFSAIDRPLSTFSVDVDAASYSNVRRFITQGQLPPVDAVRIEELINYFDYDYPDPRGPHPFSITTEVAASPWSPGHLLVHIGLQGRRLDLDRLPPSNLVFLLDVSGSMNQPDKLPLLKASLGMLVDQLREEDSVAIVVYAGAAGLVLPPTPGCNRDEILCAIDRLEAGGSTAGAAGIQLAYQVARESFIRGGNNRVILATDGDFNVGVSSEGELKRLIERERRSGVFLTVLGFGQGNLKDSKMEQLADAGNGHYAYIDNLLEGQKVLVNEIGATLLTIAKDVKLQVEFNPARVASYRLIGYENRLLRDRDFDDDRKDAGEIGAGHSVTAIYEIEPVEARHEDGRGRRYSKSVIPDTAWRSAELLTVSFRYKRPNETESRLMAVPVKDRRVAFERASETFRFSAAVAEFGMLLRESDERGKASMEHVIRTARAARGDDSYGYRSEFVALAEMARTLMCTEMEDGREVGVR